MDPHKQIFTVWVLSGSLLNPFALLTFFPLPLLPCQGYRKSLTAHHAVCTRSPRTGPLVHFLRLLTPLELLHHLGFMQSSTPLHVAWSCPCRSKPSAPESPQAYLKIPSSLDLQILTWGQKGKGAGHFWEMLDVSSAHSSSDYFFQPFGLILSLLCFMVLVTIKIHPEC